MAHETRRIATVGELIEQLQKYRPEAQLVFNGLGGTKEIIGIADYEMEYSEEDNLPAKQTVEIQLLNTELI